MALKIVFRVRHEVYRFTAYFVRLIWASRETQDIEDHAATLQVMLKDQKNPGDHGNQKKYVQESSKQ